MYFSKWCKYFCFPVYATVVKLLWLGCNMMFNMYFGIIIAYVLYIHVLQNAVILRLCRCMLNSSNYFLEINKCLGSSVSQGNISLGEWLKNKAKKTI